MQDLTVSLVQTGLFWEDKQANLTMLEKKIDEIRQTDLVILPEMFTTGFTMHARDFAEDMEGPSVLWLQKVSAEKKIDILGSLIISENGNYYNRLLWVKPDGKIYFYDKRHLFRIEGEDKVYTPGDSKLTVELNGWKIRPFICYDIRFPVWTRNFGNEYHAAVFIANWPEKRSFHWKTLLAARAIENLAYIIGVNRIGRDGNGISYSGDSTIIDAAGKILFEQAQLECVHTVTLSHSALIEYQRSFPVWMDADPEI
ncbi:MAG: amidohydrolase [Candidatus Aminicenantes bacterium]|nr:amidohydrolase [Candidatus Aminicenantes bacterium]